MSFVMDENSITIDLKRNRMRLLKSAVQVLGEPQKVQLLVNPYQKAIMIRSATDDTPGGQTLSVHPTKPYDYYEIYSLHFVQRLQRLFPDMQDCCTYRVHGKPVLKENGIVFLMNTLERIGKE